ncbi:excinuclease ABC subunit UvrA [Stieleria sp. TO1_6]|uniref:excinuclease ABC subunit UvrA n=1 Tax=Stieleria tagensis TaxID=2956795 RepID=UPI00209B2CCE|nr:excinuclease ABC subunit UvrA [Stieleria tagensis]MCO8125067.1 excinuclease ABC subunit UvrA [Stieleria tagensis]
MPKPRSANSIRIRGARVHNLQSVDVDIPRDALTVITGVSGSGKSSLAFDTLFAEGQRQYIDSLSAYARQFLDSMPRPDVDLIEGLAPTMAIDQKPGSTSARSTVATITEIYDYLRLLFARVGLPHCGVCGSAIARQSVDAIQSALLRQPDDTKLVLMAPMVRGRKGAHREVMESIQASGLVRVRVDGEMHLLEDVPELAIRKNHTIEAVVDRLVLRDGIESRLADSLSLALRLTGGLVTTSVLDADGNWNDAIYSTAMACIECGASIEEIEPRTFSFNSPYGACPQCDGLGRIDSGDGQVICPTCHGGRLRSEAMGVTIDGVSINQLTAMSLGDADQWISKLGPGLSKLHQAVAQPIQTEVAKRLQFLQRVGVPYLTLDRSAETLSGGELQRVRLATSIGSGLVGVCYVLDEPSIGLHPADHGRLIECLRQLQRQGNTVVVVEHDEATMRAADRLIDVGPGAGAGGGRIMASGTPKQIQANKNSLTGRYLAGVDAVPIPVSRRPAERFLTLSNVTTHNLKNITVKFPLGCFIGISGVSGSGKSSLAVDTLLPALTYQLEHGKKRPTSDDHVAQFGKLTGSKQLDKLVSIDQAPIGRSPRSCPATYSGVLDEIRKVFAATRESKTRGFTASRFSFNSTAGRCELCKGQGVQRIPMNFLSDLFITCARCGGKRFNRQTLQVRFKGANVADILAMTIDEATEFFEHVPSAHRLLSSLQMVGLGYMHLGQSSTTLSGGEAQRIKLGTELARKSTGKTLYLLDEPTTGLHFSDVKRLIAVLQQLVDAGNTVVVIEHDFDLLACCDWIIDLGPTGGAEGGYLLGQATPEEISRLASNATADFLSEKLAAAKVCV